MIKYFALLLINVFCLILNSYSQTHKTREIEKLTHDWVNANNTQNLEKLKSLYASSLNFYAIKKDAITCLNEKKDFFKRYPSYSLSISNLDIDFYKSGIIRCNFVKNETWGNEPRNPQQAYLLFQKQRNVYKIIAESDQRMDSQRGNVPDLGNKVQKRSNTTYMLIGAASLLLILGVIFLIRKNQEQKKKLKSIPMLYSQQLTNGHKADLPIFSPEEIKKNDGLAFEQFVVKNFDPNYFKLLNWRGDKYVDGHYPLSSFEPDLDYFYQDSTRKESFAVECKWRKDFVKNTITLAEERQLNNYRSYQQAKNYPVFIILGIGGSGSKPENLYIIPLNEIYSPTLTKEKLSKYYRYKKGKFFLEIPAMKLQ